MLKLTFFTHKANNAGEVGGRCANALIFNTVWVKFQKNWFSVQFFLLFQKQGVMSSYVIVPMDAVGLLRILLACCKDTALLNWICNLFKSGHIRHVLVQSQQWKQQNIQWNIFKYNDKNTRTTSIEAFCKNSWGLLAVNYFHKKGSIDVVLVFSLFTLSRFHTLFWCIIWWSWTNKCRLGLS